MLLLHCTLLLQFSWLFLTGFRRPEDAHSKHEVRHDFLLLLTPTSTISAALFLSTIVSARTSSMPDASTARCKPTKANLEAKREAQARYRARQLDSDASSLDRHKEELRRKARESMARLRANLSPHDCARYRKTAREDGARYRADNRALLAQKEVLRRARKSIPRIGYDEWCAKYEKRHKRPVPVALQAQLGPPMPSEADSPVFFGPTTPSIHSRSTTAPTTTSVRSRSTEDAPTVPTPPAAPTPPRLAPSWRRGYAGCPGMWDVGPPPPGWANHPLQVRFTPLGVFPALSWTPLTADESEGLEPAPEQPPKLQQRMVGGQRRGPRHAQRGVGRGRGQSAPRGCSQKELNAIGQASEIQEEPTFSPQRLGANSANGGTQWGADNPPLIFFVVAVEPGFLRQCGRDPAAKALLLAGEPTPMTQLFQCAVAPRHLVTQAAARGVVRREWRERGCAGGAGGNGGGFVQRLEARDDGRGAQAVLSQYSFLLFEITLAASAAAAGACAVGDQDAPAVVEVRRGAGAGARAASAEFLGCFTEGAAEATPWQDAGTYSDSDMGRCGEDVESESD
ncbi:hypothetical protein C8R47DRAFT_1078773 [Mycena vitilis]|nr:hypothetical protein C8R47DRAFT_1078773 [Mycena vitilis]